jgi:hypothetical protein
VSGRRFLARSSLALCLALLAAFAVSACGGSGSPATRLVGARRLALAVPADWRSDVGGCPSVPREVVFPVPEHSAAPGCEMSGNEALPNYDTVEVYILPKTYLGRPQSCCRGEFRDPGGAPSGTVHGMPYYILDSKVLGTGVGVAETLNIPQVGVAFLVGARDHAAANFLLATIRYVNAGTRLR